MSVKKGMFLLLTGLAILGLIYSVIKNFTMEQEITMAWVQVGVLVAVVIAHVFVWLKVK